MEATSILTLELAPEISFRATANTKPICFYNPRIRSLGIVGFFAAVIQRLGTVAGLPGHIYAEKDPQAAAHEIAKDHLDAAMLSWISMLELDNVFPNAPVLTLDLDKPNPTKQEIKAFSFIMTITMLEHWYKWDDEELYALYRSKVQQHKTAQIVFASSGQTFMSARQMYAMLQRRLFETQPGGTFGLCPAETKVGDYVVFFYGCRTPMVVRPVAKGGKLYRLIGEAYMPYQMEGESLEKDMVENRYRAGLRDSIYWIV